MALPFVDEDNARGDTVLLDISSTWTTSLNVTADGGVIVFSATPVSPETRAAVTSPSSVTSPISGMDEVVVVCTTPVSNATLPFGVASVVLLRGGGAC